MKIIKLLLFLLLVPGLCFGVTYNIGPGETYETFTALEIGEVLAPGNIVDGGGNTFTEIWEVKSSGDSGNHIIIRNAIIDVNGGELYGVFNNLRNYITYQNLTIKNATVAMLYISKGHDIVVDNCFFTGNEGGNGIRMFTNDATDVYNINITDNTFDTIDSYGILMFFGSTVGAGGTGEIRDILVDNNVFVDIVDSVNKPSAIKFLFNTLLDSLVNDRLPYGLTYTNNSFNTISGNCIDTYADDTAGATNLIKNNRCVNAGYGNLVQANGIQLHYVKSMVVENNYINGIITSGEGDGSGIIADYANGDETYNSVGVIIRNNEVTGADDNESTPSINIFACTNCEVYGNLTYGNSVGIKQNLATTTGTIITNNTSVNNTKYNYYATNDSAASILKNNISYGSDIGYSLAGGGSGFSTENNNLAYGATTSNFDGFTEDVTSFVGNPQFVSSTNFQLKENSSAIEKGTGTKINGRPADIGAFQTSNYIKLSKLKYNKFFKNSPGAPLGSTQNEIQASIDFIYFGDDQLTFGAQSLFFQGDFL